MSHSRFIAPQYRLRLCCAANHKLGTIDALAASPLRRGVTVAAVHGGRGGQRAAACRLALLGPLVGALGTAMRDEGERCPALLAFASSAAAVSFGGIAAVWGQAAGLAEHALEPGLRARRQRGVP